MSALADFWFCRIGGTIDKTVTPHEYSGGDISRIDEVPRRWRNEVRDIIESNAVQATESDSEPVSEQEGTEVQEGASEASGTVTDLSGMTKSDLIQYADDHGVHVLQSWTKAEIIAAIREAE